MQVQFEKFGFYRINRDYLKYLHSKDSQVFYEATKKYEKKPYLGIIVELGDMKYCIPLTSAKPRQLNWANISKHNLIIYENVYQSELHTNDVYKIIGTSNVYKKILSVLEMRKMIPINDNLCTYIEFDKVGNIPYQNLLEKEYRFLKPLKSVILKKVTALYNKQKSTGVIESCHCNFDTLEIAYHEYVQNHPE